MKRKKIDYRIYRLIKKKKAMVLIILLAVLSIFIIFPSLYLKLLASRDVFNAKIGELQFNILENSNSIQEDLFYIDQSAKYSAITALQNLEKSGGYSDVPCGVLKGYSMWYTEKGKCYPLRDDIILSIESEINPILNSYLLKNKLPVDNYDYFITYLDGKIRIIGTATQNLKNEILFSGNKIGELSIKPSFDIITNYDLAFYDIVTEEFFSYSGVLNTIQECEMQESINTCVNKAFLDFNSANSQIKLSTDCENIDDNKEDRNIFVCAERKNVVNLEDVSNGGVKSSQNIKFVINVPKKQQSSVTGIDIINPQGEDKRVILKWKSVKNKDVTGYNIYLSSSASKQNAEKFLVLNINSVLTSAIDDKCRFDSIGASCSPYFEAGKLFSDNAGNYYYPVLMKKDSFIAIVPVDKSGTELVNFEFVKAKIADKLAIGKVDYSVSYDSIKKEINIDITAAASNVDSSPFLGDLKRYYVFVQKDSQDGIIKINNLKSESKEQKITVSLDLGLGEYYVGVIAQDTSNNPLFIKQISATDREISVNSEYTSIINDLASPQKIVVS